MLTGRAQVAGLVAVRRGSGRQEPVMGLWERVDGLLTLVLGVALEKADGEWSVLLAYL